MYLSHHSILQVLLQPVNSDSQPAGASLPAERANSPSCSRAREALATRSLFTAELPFQAPLSLKLRLGAARRVRLRGADAEGRAGSAREGAKTRQMERSRARAAAAVGGRGSGRAKRQQPQRENAAATPPSAGTTRRHRLAEAGRAAEGKEPALLNPALTGSGHLPAPSPRGRPAATPASSPASAPPLPLPRGARGGAGAAQARSGGTEGAGGAG